MIAELAERQHGVVSRRQLLAAGVSDEVITARVATRRLYRLHDGVFSLTRHPGQRGLFMAAHLAARGLVSHRSALTLWDLRAGSGAVDVTIPYGRRAARRGIRIHDTRRLDPADRARVHGIPCTNWPRTIIDFAARAQEADLRAVLERTQVLRLFDAKTMCDALDRAPGKRGTGTLRAVLALVRDDPPPSRSDFERLFLGVIEAAGLPRPVVNGIVCGHEVDFHWPHARLIVEADGRATHDTAIAFERDRRRDLELKLAHWEVIRITWRQLRDEPERIVALLRARLGGLGL